MKVTAAITRVGGSIVAVDTVDAKGDHTIREITVECGSVDHRGKVISAVQSVTVLPSTHETMPALGSSFKGATRPSLRASPAAGYPLFSFAGPPPHAHVANAMSPTQNSLRFV